MVDSIVRLFPEDSTDFTSNGLGYLPDVTSCEVNEERNGSFELMMKYPITGKRYKDITKRRILVAKPNPYDNPQPFRIYSISRPFNGIVTFNAEHISYDLSGIPVAPFESNTLGSALGSLKSKAILSYPFTFWTDNTVNNYFHTTAPNSVKSILGGLNPSLIDAYGGECEFDNYSVKIHNARGGDHGYTIRYGKNLTDLMQEEDVSKVYTGVYPYWYKDDSGLVEADPKVIPTGVNASSQRIYILDCSQDFADPPNSSDLTKMANDYMKDNNVITPEVTLTVSFIALTKTKEYETLSVLDKVKLCDYVTVVFEKMGVNAKLKCTKTTYNVLTDRYDSITLGTPATTLAKTIVQNKEQASSDLAIVDNNTNTKIETVNRNIRYTLEEHVSEIIDDMTTMEKDFKTELDLTARGLRLEISEVDRTLTNDINTATTEFNNKIEATARQFSIDLSEVNKSLTQDIVDNVRDLNGKIDDTDKKLSGTITATVTEFDNKLDLTARKFSLELSEVNKTLTGEIDSTNHTLANEVTRVTNEYTAAIEATAKSLRATISEVDRSLSSDIDSVETSYKAEIAATSKSILQSVSSTYSTKDEYKELSASLLITDEKVETKVSAGDISSVLSQDSGGVDIAGNRFTLQSTNLNIYKNGDILSSGYIKSVDSVTNTTRECRIQQGAVNIYKNGSLVGRFSARPSYEGVEMYGIPMAAVWSSAGAGYVCTDPNQTSWSYHNNFYGKTWLDDDVKMDNDLVVDGNITGHGTLITNGDIGTYGSIGVQNDAHIYGSANIKNNLTVSGNFKAGTYTITGNEIQSNTGFHAMAASGKNVYLRGEGVYCLNQSDVYKTVYAADFSKQSLRRIKENFSDITDEEALKILDVTPLHFDYINGKKSQAGFVADDLVDVFPDVCTYTINEETNEEELFGIDYSSFTPYFAKLFQRQERIIREQEDRIARLELLVSQLIGRSD